MLPASHTGGGSSPCRILSISNMIAQIIKKLYAALKAKCNAHPKSASVDYLLTGINSQNKSYSEDLGLSDSAVECLKRARVLAQGDAPSRTGTIPYMTGTAQRLFPYNGHKL